MSERQWARKHTHCVVCGTDEIPHKAKGRCETCYPKERWPDRWPAHIAGCLCCGKSKRDASYRQSGLCGPCARSMQPSQIERYKRTLEALKYRPPTLVGHRQMLIDVLRGQGGYGPGCKWVAEALSSASRPVRPQTVRKWAMKAGRIPARYHAGVERLWDAHKGVT